MGQGGAIEIVGLHPGPDVDRAPIGDITQPSERPVKDWQVEYDEKLLDADGRSVAFDLFLGERRDAERAVARITSYLDPRRARCRSGFASSPTRGRNGPPPLGADTSRSRRRRPGP